VTLSLTTSLVLLGVVVLLLVALQGWWVARRAAPRRPLAGAGSAQRVEPALDDGQAPGAATESALRPAAARPPARIDALIDVVVPLALDAPVSGDLVLAHLPASHRVGSRQLRVEGLDAHSGDWVLPESGGRYSELQAAVQLAARGGALNEIEYSEFVQTVQAFADATGAVADFPDMLGVIARARELDAFAAPLDAVLTVTLRANEVAWSVGFVQQCAQRLGFCAGTVAGRLVKPAAEDGAPPLLVLAFDPQAALAEEGQGAAVRECTLALDVPQSPESAEPFPAWHDAARTLADDMGATLVDDQGQPVTLHAFAAIGTELQRIYRELEAHDLAAGSATARRLFS